MRMAGLALLVVCAAACNPSKTVMQLGVPGSGVDMNVARVKLRDGFLDTELHGDGFSLRTFLPASEVCQRIVSGEAALQYRANSSYGTLVRGEERCDASGIGSLREWRNRRPRETSSVIPSGRAEYRVVYQDEELTFLRGTFPLVGLLGFAGMGDNIAVVPNTPVCLGLIGRNASTIEYFHGGSNVLTLSSSEGRCNIEGLIRPLSGADLQQ